MPDGEIESAYREPEKPKEKPLTEEEGRYLEDVIAMYRTQVDAGYWTLDQATEYLGYVYDRIQLMGIIPTTPYYKEVAAYRETQARIRSAGPLAGSLLEVSSRFEEDLKGIQAQDLPYEEKMRQAANLYQEYARTTPIIKQFINPYKAEEVLGSYIETTLTPKQKEALKFRRTAWAEAQGAPYYPKEAGRAEARRAKILRETKYPLVFEAAKPAGTQPWRDWFESQYSSLVRRFQVAPAEEVEKGFPAWLAKETPKLREEWFSRTLGEQGGRARAFQPMIRTVKW